jgi:hypothetical protein
LAICRAELKEEIPPSAFAHGLEDHRSGVKTAKTLAFS